LLRHAPPTPAVVEEQVRMRQRWRKMSQKFTMMMMVVFGCLGGFGGKIDDDEDGKDCSRPGG
jgi:hypothetical protein